MRGVVVLALSLAAATPALACDCEGASSASDSARRLAVIVAGRVVSVEPLTRQQNRVTLHVAEAWKGARVGARREFTVDDSDCGVQLLLGDDVLLYAPSEGPLTGCGANAARVVHADRTEDLAALGPPAASASGHPPLDPGPLVEAEGKVDVVSSGPRSVARVAVTRAIAGTERGATLRLTTPQGGCGQPFEPRIGQRVWVRGFRQGDVVLISPCLEGSRFIAGGSSQRAPASGAPASTTGAPP